MKNTEDYELYDTDFDEFIRIGMESFGLLPFEPTKAELNEDQQITKDQSA